MERSQLFDLMGELKLYGMKAAFDEIMATAVKRQHEPQRIIGDLQRRLTTQIKQEPLRRPTRNNRRSAAPQPTALIYINARSKRGRQKKFGAFSSRRWYAA